MKYFYGKSVLLTGGSSGIGRVTASLLAQAGFTVYSASRNPDAGTTVDFAMSDNAPTPSGTIIPVKLDVRDINVIAITIDELLSKADIGIVIHCAGVGIATPAEDYKTDAIENLMDTNLFGVMKVNSRVLPHFRKRGGGLCIIVSSVASLFPIPFQSHYCASKSALDSYASTLRMEVSDYNIKVSLVLPGDTNTGFTSARKYEIEEDSPYYDVCFKAVKKMENDELSGKPARSVSSVILKICKRNNPPQRVIVGLDYKLLAFMKKLLSERLISYILKRMYMGGK